jgi:hypothetical protein
MSINKYFLWFTLILVFLLSACSGSEQVIEIKGKESLKTLLIEKVDGNSSSEEMTKIVKDKDKIEKVLSKIEGLKVKESSNEHLFDEIKSQSTYTFGFSENEEIESGKEVPYAFSVLNDGTLIFTHKDVGSPITPRITTVKDKDLLNDIKQILEIQF